MTRTSPCAALTAALSTPAALGAALLLALSGPATAQEAQTYPMAQGGTLTLPAGDISFADRVVAFDEGDPPSERDDARNPEAVLGPPNRDAAGEGAALTLGCHGALTVAFANNALVDRPGPDLHVWEVGDDVEPTEVAISRDGTGWIDVGAIGGGTASLDIADSTEPGDSFRYLRLTDVDCQGRSGRWPGADIDAIAAVGTAERFTFSGDVLFAFDAATLSPEAEAALVDFAETVAGRDLSRLVIEGHTDSRGSTAYNADLSRERAEAVRRFLDGRTDLAGLELTARGRGEGDPVADNATEAGRRQNRRVEILALP